jgi:hypothetical protein
MARSRSPRDDRKADEAFAVYAAHMRPALRDPALLDDPQWQATREKTLGTFLSAFGVGQ